MKKPDITEGEWRYGDTAEEYLFVVEAPHHQGVSMTKIADVYDYPQANAKAISAVPEMIDALIDIIESFEGGYEAKNTLDSIENCKQALKKAGVEL